MKPQATVDHFQLDAVKSVQFLNIYKIRSFPRIRLEGQLLKLDAVVTKIYDGPSTVLFTGTIRHYVTLNYRMGLNE